MPTLSQLRRKNFKNDVCKNASFVEEAVEGFAVKIKVNKGCKNLRADGSSRCEKCSKKNNEKK
jgi:hypothetical protein